MLMKAGRGPSKITKRSVCIRGRQTAVSLEHEFWVEVISMAKARGLRTYQYIEQINRNRGNQKLSSALRCAVLAKYTGALLVGAALLVSPPGTASAQCYPCGGGSYPDIGLLRGRLAAVASGRYSLPAPPGTAYYSLPPAPAPITLHSPPLRQSAPRPVIHNGSLMQVSDLGGGRIQITYAQPRPDLWGTVGPGTLLLDGQWDHGTLHATARAFTRYCPMPFPYAVTGSVSAEGVLTVIGPAPLVDPYSCSVVGSVWSANATLVFVPDAQR